MGIVLVCIDNQDKTSRSAKLYLRIVNVVLTCVLLVLVVARFVVERTILVKRNVVPAHVSIIHMPVQVFTCLMELLVCAICIPPGVSGSFTVWEWKFYSDPGKTACPAPYVVDEGSCYFVYSYPYAVISQVISGRPARVSLTCCFVSTQTATRCLVSFACSGCICCHDCCAISRTLPSTTGLFRLDLKPFLVSYKLSLCFDQLPDVVPRHLASCGHIQLAVRSQMLPAFASLQVLAGLVCRIATTDCAHAFHRGGAHQPNASSVLELHVARSDDDGDHRVWRCDGCHNHRTTHLDVRRYAGGNPAPWWPGASVSWVSLRFLERSTEPIVIFY